MGETGILAASNCRRQELVQKIGILVAFISKAHLSPRNWQALRLYVSLDLGKAARRQRNPRLIRNHQDNHVLRMKNPRLDHNSALFLITAQIGTSKESRCYLAISHCRGRHSSCKINGKHQTF